MMQFTPSKSYKLTQTGSNVQQSFNSIATASQALYVYNAGAAVCFIIFGIGAQTALSDGTCMAVAPGDRFVMNKGLADSFATIGTNADVLYLSAGEGQ